MQNKIKCTTLCFGRILLRAISCLLFPFEFVLNKIELRAGFELTPSRYLKDHCHTCYEIDIAAIVNIDVILELF